MKLTHLQRGFLISGIMLAALLWYAQPSHAGNLCGPREPFVQSLADKWQESSKAMALAGNVNVMEIFAAKSGTWTILMTPPQGLTCIWAAGTGWKDLTQIIEGTPL